MTLTWTAKRCVTCKRETPHDKRRMTCHTCGTVYDPHHVPPAYERGTPDEQVEQALAESLSMFPTTPPSNGTPTSDAAAASLSDAEINRGHRKVLNALWRHRTTGLTDEQIQEVADLNPSSQRPRRGELVEYGWVEDSGQTRETHSGRQATVWRLTFAARQRAARNLLTPDEEIAA